MTSGFSLTKPWNRLDLSRKAYATLKPWKKAGMKRESFEELLLALPDHVIQEIKLHGQVEQLTSLLFNDQPSES